MNYFKFGHEMKAKGGNIFLHTHWTLVKVGSGGGGVIWSVFDTHKLCWWNVFMTHAPPHNCSKFHIDFAS
jgi:hypothetical protein